MEKLVCSGQAPIILVSDVVRQINFKPGQAGYQKFGVDDADAAAHGVTEYQKG